VKAVVNVCKRFRTLNPEFVDDGNLSAVYHYVIGMSSLCCFNLLVALCLVKRFAFNADNFGP